MELTDKIKKSFNAGGGFKNPDLIVNVGQSALQNVSKPIHMDSMDNMNKMMNKMDDMKRMSEKKMGNQHQKMKMMEKTGLNNPMTRSGGKVMSKMMKEYGMEKGKKVFYATANKNKKAGKKWHK